MSRRSLRWTRSRSEPGCSRCENEIDITVWFDGARYCRSCVNCRHEFTEPWDAVCRQCLQRLHTVITADGPRIGDVVAYAVLAWDEYGVPAHDLRVWKFEEEEELQRHELWLAARGPAPEVLAAPPHHRFG